MYEEEKYLIVTEDIEGAHTQLAYKLVREK